MWQQPHPIEKPFHYTIINWDYFHFKTVCHSQYCSYRPVCWLSGNTHKLAHHNWGACRIGRVFDIFHTTLNKILDDITVIHAKSTMMSIFQEMLEELTQFKEFLVYEFQNKKTDFVFKSQTKAFPLTNFFGRTLLTPRPR